MTVRIPQGASQTQIDNATAEAAASAQTLVFPAGKIAHAGPFTVPAGVTAAGAGIWKQSAADGGGGTWLQSTGVQWHSGSGIKSMLIGNGDGTIHPAAGGADGCQFSLVRFKGGGTSLLDLSANYGEHWSGPVKTLSMTKHIWNDCEFEAPNGGASKSAGGIFNIWWDCRIGGAQVHDLYFNRCHLGVKNSGGHTGIARCLLFQPAPSAHDDSGPSLGGGSVVTLAKLNRAFKWSQVDHGCYNIQFTDTLFELPISGSSIGKGFVMIDACEWARNYSTWMGSDTGASDSARRSAGATRPAADGPPSRRRCGSTGLTFTRCFKKGGSVIGELGRNCSSVDSNFRIGKAGLFDNETVGNFMALAVADLQRSVGLGLHAESVRLTRDCAPHYTELD